MDLIRAMRALGPQLLFLSVQDMEKALATVRTVEVESPGVQIVAVDRTCDPTRLIESMRAGLREFLSPPFTEDAVKEMALRIAAQLERQPEIGGGTNHIYSFLPAKAGSGASTIALNVAAAISRGEKSRVLLSDFDLSSGMLRFLLNLDREHSVINAVQHAGRLDEDLWAQLVATHDQLDVLHAGPLDPNVRVESEPIQELIGFLRRQYTALCFDLSGNLEKYSLEIMQESRRVLLVCTPEVPSLHMAREKIAFLRRLDLADRVGVIVNRFPKRSAVSPGQIQDLLGVPVFRIVPNDYPAVMKAMNNARYVDPETELGRAYEEIGRALCERKNAAAESKKKKFIEFFSMQPRAESSSEERRFPAPVARRLLG
jgi:pilus assembly protein CpaE